MVDPVIEVAPKLEARAASFVKEARLPGAAVGVVHGDDLVWSAGVGFADVAARRAPENTTLYRIASITKTFTGTAIMQLRDEGLLHLDDPAVAHLPERSSVAVTIRFPDVRSLPAVVVRVKRVFDLGADIVTIDKHLARDPKLAPLIAKRPGLRAPGDWERETLVVTIDDHAPRAWRPWHAYAAQHLRMASHG